MLKPLRGVSMPPGPGYGKLLQDTGGMSAVQGGGGLVGNKFS